MGKVIEISMYSFFSYYYSDKKSQELDKEYSITESSEQSGNLGKAELEIICTRLIKLLRAVEHIVGFERKDFEDFLNPSDKHYLEDLISHRRFLRSETVKGCEVLFPTEEFLEHHNVPRRIKFPTGQA